MKSKIFEGAAVALITPFNADGSINFQKLEELVDYHIKNKTDAIVVCATTGEAPALEDDEHIEAISKCVKRAKGNIPIIAGTGSNNTAHAVMMNREAEKVGADGLLWVSPYYNKTTQKGLVEHFETLSKSTSLPAILYNVPGRTGVNILPETVKKLSQLENIVAIKEASGNVKQTIEIKKLCGSDMTVYSGDDDIIVPLMSVGAEGVISVLSNILPNETHDMCRLCLDGNYKEAAKLQIKYTDLVKALFCEVNPIPVKTAMNMLKMNVGGMRLPLCEMEEKNRDYLKKCLMDLGFKIQ